MSMGRGGNSRDLDVAFGEHQSVLIRFIASRVRCRATAEDIAQEVFLRLQRVRGATILNPRAFLFRIAANLAFNHKLQIRRRAEVADDIKRLLWSEIDELSPERALMGEQELSRIGHLLDSLPARTQQVLLLSRFDGLKQSEIAKRLGISTTAVENHLRRAVEFLATAASDDRDE